MSGEDGKLTHDPTPLLSYAVAMVASKTSKEPGANAEALIVMRADVVAAPSLQEATALAHEMALRWFPETNGFKNHRVALTEIWWQNNDPIAMSTPASKFYEEKGMRTGIKW